ncbi:MAG: nucleotidyltransferase family protein [Candidatus Saliniplasma sp.]
MGKAVKKILEEHKDEIKERFGVESIGLFGSCAKGMDDEQSDVDIIVEFKEPNFDDFMELTFYLEELLDRRVDILTLEGLRHIRIPKVSKDISRSVVYV